MEGTVRITQGYGMTYFARTGFYGGGPHTGLDMVSSNTVIKSPKSGTLYKGATNCGGSTMKWVAVDHGSGMMTWYFHVQ
jgi:murein DD-endopeptidase MepM/ murein hydrolase activator NlpD